MPVIVSVGDGAELQHVRLMEDALDAANITTADFSRLGGKAKLNTFNLTRGGSVSRYQGFITFAGEGSELATNGVNPLGGRRHGDTTLLVDHAVPHCASREVFAPARCSRTVGIRCSRAASSCARTRRRPTAR